MSISRRTVLRTGIFGGSVVLAGCSGLTTDWTKFELEEVSDSHCRTSDPIQFENLSNAQQEIVQTALTESAYRVEHGEESPAFEQIVDMVERRTEDDIQAYLQHETTCYSIFLRLGEDHIVAAPD